MMPTTQQQTQQFALSQAQHALEQLGAAHGLLGGIDWEKVLLGFLQLILATRKDVEKPTGEAIP